MLLRQLRSQCSHRELQTSVVLGLVAVIRVTVALNMVGAGKFLPHVVINVVKYIYV